MSWLGLSAAFTPNPAPSRIISAIEPQIILRRRFFPFFPVVPPFNALPPLDISWPPGSGFCSHALRYGGPLGKVPYPTQPFRREHRGKVCPRVPRLTDRIVGPHFFFTTP